MATTSARSPIISPEELELLDDELELELELEDDDEALEELLEDDELFEEPEDEVLPPQPTSAIDAKAGASQRES